VTIGESATIDTGNVNALSDAAKPSRNSRGFDVCQYYITFQKIINTMSKYDTVSAIIYQISLVGVDSVEHLRL
jgi:hypothetical protein